MVYSISLDVNQPCDISRNLNEIKQTNCFMLSKE